MATQSSLGKLSITDAEKIVRGTVITSIAAMSPDVLAILSKTDLGEYSSIIIGMVGAVGWILNYLANLWRVKN